MKQMYTTSFRVYGALYTDVELSYCLANLTAVIMACPRQNNHLWYHLYALHKLHGSYIPSFMVCLSVHNTTYSEYVTMVCLYYLCRLNVLLMLILIIMTVE